MALETTEKTAASDGSAVPIRTNRLGLTLDGHLPAIGRAGAGRRSHHPGEAEGVRFLGSWALVAEISLPGFLALPNVRGCQ